QALLAAKNALPDVGCNVDGVLPTTNHLESFNRVFKYRHLPTAQRGGRRLRVDVLLQQLIMKILPSIFEFRALEEEEEARWEAQLSRLPGGDALLKAMEQRKAADLPPVAYLVADVRRDAAATNILQSKQVGSPEFEEKTRTFHFSCYSSLVTPSDPHPVAYQVCLGVRGTALCNCPDFCNRGGACKHIRAALLYLNALRQQVPTIPLITLPTSEVEARGKQLLDSEDVHSSSLQSPTHAMARAAAAIEDLLQESDGLEVAEDAPTTPPSEDAPQQECGDHVAIPARTVDAPSGEVADFQFALPSASSASTSVAAQSLGRVLLQLDKDAPKLGQLAEFLKSVPRIESPKDIERATNGAGHLRSLLSELERLVTVPTTLSTTATTATTSAPCPTTPAPRTQTSTAQRAQTPAGRTSTSNSAISAAESRRRKAGEIIGLSPEKKQKRHKSYSIFW
ncbi:hypothetical protein EIP86_005308, partial [Pleurotus ostreatoroseus]